MVCKAETMPIQKNHSAEKKAHNCREFQSQYSATSDSFELPARSRNE